MYACTNCNGCQFQFSLCNGLCKYRHLITFYLAIKGFSNASRAEQMWIWQTQFGRPETSTHMLILQRHKACKKQLCRYGSPNNCQEVPIVKGSKQLRSDCLEWKEHLNRCKSWYTTWNLFNCEQILCLQPSSKSFTRSQVPYRSGLWCWH